MPPFPTGIVRVTEKNESLSCASCKGIALTVRCVALPLAPSVDEQHLGIEHLLVIVRQLIAVLMITGVHRTPREITVVATVVQRRGTGRCRNNRKVCLMFGTAQLCQSMDGT